MRFTSLVVELIRARPRLVVWVVVLIQAALWLTLSLAFYRSPPGDLATMLAFGREYQIGTELGPPLSFWLADLAFRLAGNHPFGVYLLAQLCAVVTFIALYQLGRAIVGAQQAVLAVLLSMTVLALFSSGVEFGPLVLARPLWALLLLHSWQLIGQNRRDAWFAWSIEAGLLLLTTSAAIGLILLVVVFAVATDRGRQRLKSFDPVFAVLVVVALALPYLMWLIRADALLPGSPPGMGILHWGAFVAGLVATLAGVILLVILNSVRVAGEAEDAPTVQRPPVDPLGRQFVYVTAITPIVAGSLIAGLFNIDRADGDAGVVFLMSGLAVVIAAGDLIHLRHLRRLRMVWAAAVAAPAAVAVCTILFLPWIGLTEVPTSLPSASIARFFVDSFERRTNHRLRTVTGDPELASLIAMGSGRPHLLLEGKPRTTWLTPAEFNETGGIVVWRAADTAGTPPAEIARRFPGLVPEVPRAFEWLINGRLPTLRIGWAIVRPKEP